MKNCFEMDGSLKGGGRLFEAVKKGSSLLFGVIATLLCALNLPFGLFINISSDFLYEVFGNVATHWITMLLVFSVVVIVIGVMCGVVAAVLYVRSKKKLTDILGLCFAVLSFLIAVACITLDIVGLMLW